MNLSKETKDIDTEYIQKLKIQIKNELGFEVSNKILAKLKQKHMSILHAIERDKKLTALNYLADQLGYTLIKKEKR